jgi:hypothetical protein
MGFDLSARNGPPRYFSLNIWAMGTMRSILNRADALDWEAETAVPPPYPLNPLRVIMRIPKNGPAMTEPARRGSHGFKKSPAHKFIYNDEELVTPEECTLLPDTLNTRAANCWPTLRAITP